jgi:hypothetical protein
MDPTAVARNTISTVALAPLGRDPRVQVTVVATRAQVPWVGTAETYVLFAGTGSVTTTFVAVAGPALDAVIR